MNKSSKEEEFCRKRKRRKKYKRKKRKNLFFKLENFRKNKNYMISYNLKLLILSFK